MASTDRGSDISVAPDSSTAALSGAVIPVTGIKQGLYIADSRVACRGGTCVAYEEIAAGTAASTASTTRSLNVCFYFGKSPLL